MKQQSTEGSSSEQQTSRNTWTRRMQKTGASLAGAGLLLTGCTVDKPATSVKPETGETTTQTGKTTVDWDNLAAPVQVDNQKLVITAKAREKTAIESKIPEYLDFSVSSEGYHSLVKTLDDIKDPELRQQASNLLGNRVLRDTKDTQYDLETSDSPYNTEDNAKLLSQVREVVGAIEDPELKAKSQDAEDIEIALALARGNYDHSVGDTEQKLLAAIKNKDIADLATKALAGDTSVESQLRTQADKLRQGVYDAQLIAWGKLWAGSSGQAASIDRERADYLAAVKNEKDTSRPAAKQELLRIIGDADNLSPNSPDYEGQIAAIRAQIEGAVVKYPELAKLAQAGVDGYIAEDVSNEYMTDMQGIGDSTKPEEFKQKIVTAESLSELILDKSTRRKADRALDLDQAVMLVPNEYAGKPSQEVVDMILAAIQDKNIKDLARKAAAGSAKAADKLDDLNRDAEQAAQDTGNKAYIRLFDGSNVEAEVVNDSIAQYEQNS